ncbi:zinc-binding dehydrogenase [Sunxiuqinia rutila]|uniref:zinc-binding dehydrogenase n=1 Tax=Sunxiuqinia rutila TaxID=1397841 RepID=UPI003D36A6B3
MLSLKANEHVDYQTKPFEQEVNDIDFVLDTIGGDYIDCSLKVIKSGATIISIVSGLNESVVEKVSRKKMNELTMVVRSNSDDMEWLADWFSKGRLWAHISKIFFLERWQMLIFSWIPDIQMGNFRNSLRIGDYCLLYKTSICYRYK